MRKKVGNLELDQKLLKEIETGYEHVTNINNPHNVSKAQVGLGNVENLSVASIRTSSNNKLRAEVRNSAPTSPANGDIWYDSGEHKFKGRANGAWV